MTEPLARRAAPSDAAALVQLRAVMLAAMDRLGQNDSWRVAALAWFAEHLRLRDQFAAYVAEHRGRVVSAAAGLVFEHPPSPANPGGYRGFVFNVATESEARGRGLASACLGGLLRWFAAETPVRMIDLTATDEGTGLYRRFGFEEQSYPAMRLHLAP